MTHNKHAENTGCLVCCASWRLGATAKTATKGGNTRGENPRDWAKKANDVVE